MITRLNHQKSQSMIKSAGTSILTITEHIYLLFVPFPPKQQFESIH